MAGSPLSLGVIGGGVGTTSASAARAVGPGLQAAHVGKEAAFTVISHDSQPNIQVLLNIYRHLQFLTYIIVMLMNIYIFLD